MQLAVVFTCLALIVLLFIWDKVRHDFVALGALFVIVVTGIIPVNTAFNGFSNPAVVTVVAVMIISKGMQYSGLLDVLSRRLNWFGSHPISIILPLSFVTAAASAFMNNVSVIMPISIKLAKKKRKSPSLLLMPLAFATLLGGMITLVGSAPNVIVSSFRAEAVNDSFKMFDFFYVGFPLAIVGILYTSLIGWRFLPKRESPISLQETIEIGDYCTELLVGADSKLVGVSLKEITSQERYNIDLIGLIRDQQYLYTLSLNELVHENDILMIKADSEDLQGFADESRLKIVIGSSQEHLPANDRESAFLEVVVMKDSPLIGKSARELNLLREYGISLLAKTGSGNSATQRINRQKFQVGDVLLIQGNAMLLPEKIVTLGCLALTERGYKIGDEKKIVAYLSIFIASIAMVLLRWLPVHIAFPMGALAMVLFGIIPYREVYKAVDWSVIVMLGAMIPFGRAMIISGGADLISNGLLYLAQYSAPWLLIGLLLTLTMMMTNLVNNATTAILMAPIAIALASGLQQSPDMYLMAVAVGACSAFLTPIGHQSSALVKGPGGYKFGDYYKVGLGVQLLMLVTAVPLLLHYWG